jgi:hypothetical protein
MVRVISKRARIAHLAARPLVAKRLELNVTCPARGKGRCVLHICGISRCSRTLGYRLI